MEKQTAQAKRSIEYRKEIHNSKKYTKEKKNRAIGTMGKNRVIAFNDPGPVFDVSFNSFTSYCQLKENYSQPESENKVPQSCPPSPPSQK